MISLIQMPTPEEVSSFLRIFDYEGLTINSHWGVQVRYVPFRIQGCSDVDRFERLETEPVNFLENVGADHEMMYRSGCIQMDRSPWTDAMDRLGQFYGDAGIATLQRLLPEMISTTWSGFGATEPR